MVVFHACLVVVSGQQSLDNDDKGIRLASGSGSDATTRKLQTVDYAQYTYDVKLDWLITGLEKIRTTALQFIPSDAHSDAMSKSLPFIGKSFNEMMGGDGKTVADLLNFTDLVQYVKNANSNLLYYNKTDLQNNLTSYLVSKAAGPSGACTGGLVSISVDTLPTPKVAITFCAKLAFTRSTSFDTVGLFDALDGFVEMETAAGAGADFTATLTFKASLKFDKANPSAPEVTIDPLNGSLSCNANADFTVALGMLDVSTTANVKAYANFTLDYCGTACNQADKNLINASKLLLTRHANFSLTGDLTLATGQEVKGITELLAGLSASTPSLTPSLTIGVADVFDPSPSVKVTPSNFTFLNNLKEFSPSNAVNLLRMADAALVRAQENTALDINLPFTKRRFSQILATGSVLTSKLLKYFVIPEPFEDRLKRSLVLNASSVFVNDPKKPLSFNISNPKELEFMIFKGSTTNTLETNPEMYKELLQDAGVTKCKFNLTSTPANATHFASLLVAGFGNCPTTIKACGTGCTADSAGDYKGCGDCDIFISVNGTANQHVFIASVAYDGSTAKDVHLMGLFDTEKNYNGPGTYIPNELSVTDRVWSARLGPLDCATKLKFLHCCSFIISFSLLLQASSSSYL